MLHALELENFKAFGKRARIPFAPITLIFGENSAGKSTTLQALYLLKQTRENRETGALLLPRAENGIVDLGSFQEMLFDHDLKRTLSIRVETIRDSDMPQLPYKENKIAIEFNFKRPSLKEEVILDQIGVYEGKSSECIAKFRLSGKTLDRSGMFYSHGVSSLKLAAAECTWLTKNIKYWKPEFEACKEYKEQILEELKEKLKNFQHPNQELQKNNKKYWEFLLKDLNDEIVFLSSDFDLKTYISKRHKEETNTVLGVQGFIAVGTSYVPTLRERIHYEPLSTFHIADLTTATGATLEQTLEALFPIRPFRKPPERSYIFSGTDPDNVGYRGDSLPDILFRNPELVEETNKWLKRLGIDYELEVKSIGAHSDDFFQVRLIDTRRKEPVSVALPDVGFGISQLLPFIVQSLVAEEQIIAIEQPEIHVHPKLQADLGDLLAAAIKKDRPNQFIVETHSEHLILRLQRLVYKGEIKPEDVSVIYVSRGPEGAKAERLRLDEEGDFIDEWPNGFFLERLRELR